MVLALLFICCNDSINGITLSLGRKPRNVKQFQNKEISNEHRNNCHEYSVYKIHNIKIFNKISATRYTGTYKEKDKTKNIWRFIKIPIMILGAITFIPIFVLSCLLMISSFDFPSFLLFVLSLFLLLLAFCSVFFGYIHPPYLHEALHLPTLL